MNFCLVARAYASSSFIPIVWLWAFLFWFNFLGYWWLFPTESQECSFKCCFLRSWRGICIIAKERSRYLTFFCLNMEVKSSDRKDAYTLDNAFLLLLILIVNKSAVLQTVSLDLQSSSAFSSFSLPNKNSICTLFMTY